MQGIIDADTHISEGEAMWAMMDKAMHPRRPFMLSVPEDTVFGNRNAFWLIDGEIYPKAGGQGELRAGHAVGAKSSGRPQRLDAGNPGDD